jgi:hypothetical protein
MYLLLRSSVAYITIVQTRLDDRDLVLTSAQQATDFPRKDVLANASRQCRNEVPMSKIGDLPGEYQNRPFGFEDLTQEIPVRGMLLGEKSSTAVRTGFR